MKIYVELYEKICYNTFIIIGGFLIMTSTNICILVTIVIYLGVMVTVGAVFSKKNKSTDDLYLG